MAKKSSFSFTKMFSPKPKNISEGYAQYTGMKIAAGAGGPGSEKFTASKKSTLGFKQAKDDLLMDLGIKKKGIDYYARLDDRVERSKRAMEDMKERRRRKNKRRARAETAAEREARLKREALARERAEGQKKRKKFYKEKGERLAKLKAKLLNLA